MLTNYKIGMPCVLSQKMVGKIIAESSKGSKVLINGIEMHSIVFFGTPHGTVIETGIVHLSDIDEEDMKRLNELETDAEKKGVSYHKY